MTLVLLKPQVPWDLPPVLSLLKITSTCLYHQLIPNLLQSSMSSSPMSLISHLSLRKDEDFPAIKKKKSRNPKPRDKWSLLWFIPSNVLNLREEVSDGKGQTVKKGKRFGFDTYNQLSCKVCRKAFHKYQSLAFHSLDKDHGRLNLSNSRSSPHSWNSVVNSRTVHTFSTKKNSVEAQRTNLVEPVRKSSRLSIKPVSYDDEIEVLEVAETSFKLNRSQKSNPVKEIDQTKFGKLTLSAKRKIVEEYNNRDENSSSPNKTNSVSKKSKKVQETKTVKPKSKISKLQELDEIEIIDVDLEEPKAKIVLKAPRTVKITKMQDEELLLAEDDVITNEDKNKKRKSENNLSTLNHKKVKSDEMVEVKSASGKSMFVNKATLEKIMASKALQKSAAAKTTNDEKILAENDQFVEKTKSRHERKSLGRSRGG